MNVEAEMSFQHEEPEFDFSYVFEYSQEGQNEPETGGCSRAMEGFFFVSLLYVLYVAQCEGTGLYCETSEVFLYLCKNA